MLFLVFAIGWVGPSHAFFGPSHAYFIHVTGDYYIFGDDDDRYSLCKAIGADTAVHACDFICKGVRAYGNQHNVIYGTTIYGTYFLLNPPKRVQVKDSREDWLSELAVLGVEEPNLTAPRPPEQPGSDMAAIVYRLLGIVAPVVVVLLVFTVTLGIISTTIVKARRRG